MAIFCPFLHGEAPYQRVLKSRAPAVAAGDDGDEDLGMPLPDWNDPDWGFDDEEAQPEKGDFWFDSSDEEDG